MSAAKIRAIEHNSKPFGVFCIIRHKKHGDLHVEGRRVVRWEGRKGAQPARWGKRIPLMGTRCGGKEGVYGRWKNMMHP